MTNDELLKLAAGLTDCEKVLLYIANTLRNQHEGGPITAEDKKPEKTLTLEDVRKVAADKARQGHTEEVRQLIQKFGADKLSGVDVVKYPDMMKELEAMGHTD